MQKHVKSRGLLATARLSCFLCTSRR